VEHGDGCISIAIMATLEVDGHPLALFALAVLSKPIA
jgi:hypothetical protein